MRCNYQILFTTRRLGAECKYGADIYYFKRIITTRELAYYEETVTSSIRTQVFNSCEIMWNDSKKQEYLPTYLWHTKRIICWLGSEEHSPAWEV